MKTGITDINVYGSTTEKALSSFSDNAANAGYILGVAKALRNEIINRIGTEIFEDEITFKEEMISRINDLIRVVSIYIGSELEK